MHGSGSYKSNSFPYFADFLKFDLKKRINDKYIKRSAAKENL